MLWLLDTCADEAHHAHSSGEENCNRCFKGRQLQIIAVCAPTLIQAGGRVWPAPFLGKLEFSQTPGLSGSGQDFLKGKKLVIAKGCRGKGCLELHNANTFCSSREQFFLQCLRVICKQFLEKGTAFAIGQYNSLSSRATALALGSFCFLLLFFGFCQPCLILPCLSHESESLDLLDYPRGFKASLWGFLIRSWFLTDAPLFSEHLLGSGLPCLARLEQRWEISASCAEYATVKT